MPEFPSVGAVDRNGYRALCDSFLNASTSEVTGYNVYRSTSRTGRYNKINPSLDPDTTYRDATIVGGSTYFYATTAVNSSGQESGYSNRSPRWWCRKRLSRLGLRALTLEI